MSLRRPFRALGLALMLALALSASAAAADPCDDGPLDACLAGCHLLCRDGCGFSFLAAPAALEAPRRATTLPAPPAPVLLGRTTPPEILPPRD